MLKQLTIGGFVWFAMVPALHAAGDIERGAQAFKLCAACHTVEPGYHRTGPSLAGVVGRKAGTSAGFSRYSRELNESGITWSDEMLDKWLSDPETLIPGTSMRINPVTEQNIRQDLIAFLKTRQASASTPAAGPGLANLSQAPAAQQVTAIQYCPDAYTIKFATGKSLTYWEFNLRFKTDSSVDGPLAGRPVFLGKGMRGDRAQIVFAEPAEISTFIRRECKDESQGQ